MRHGYCRPLRVDSSAHASKVTPKTSKTSMAGSVLIPSKLVFNTSFSMVNNLSDQLNTQALTIRHCSWPQIPCATSLQTTNYLSCIRLPTRPWTLIVNLSKGEKSLYRFDYQFVFRQPQGATCRRPPLAHPNADSSWLLFTRNKAEARLETRSGVFP